MQPHSNGITPSSLHSYLGTLLTTSCFIICTLLTTHWSEPFPLACSPPRLASFPSLLLHCQQPLIDSCNPTQKRMGWRKTGFWYIQSMYVMTIANYCVPETLWKWSHGLQLYLKISFNHWQNNLLQKVDYCSLEHCRVFKAVDALFPSFYPLKCNSTFADVKKKKKRVLYSKSVKKVLYKEAMIFGQF